MLKGLSIKLIITRANDSSPIFDFEEMYYQNEIFRVVQKEAVSIALFYLPPFLITIQS
jgi:hypothetical protein